jgi:hypothetical protein
MSCWVLFHFICSEADRKQMELKMTLAYIEERCRANMVIQVAYVVITNIVIFIFVVLCCVVLSGVIFAGMRKSAGEPAEEYKKTIENETGTGKRPEQQRQWLLFRYCWQG